MILMALIAIVSVLMGGLSTMSPEGVFRALKAVKAKLDGVRGYSNVTIDMVDDLTDAVDGLTRVVSQLCEDVYSPDEEDDV
jgi:hypothetical protein